MDPGDPGRRQTDRIANDPIARNSDCRFCNDRLQKSADPAYFVHDTETRLCYVQGRLAEIEEPG